MLSYEINRSQPIELAPTIGNGYIIGAVDEVNGRSSKETEVSLSRYEAVQLVHHWAARYEDCDFSMQQLDSVGSDTCRIKAYAARRILHFVEAGLLSKEEADRIVGEVYEKNAAAWAALTRKLEIDLNPNVSSPALDAWCAGLFSRSS